MQVASKGNAHNTHTHTVCVSVETQTCLTGCTFARYVGCLKYSAAAATQVLGTHFPRKRKARKKEEKSVIDHKSFFTLAELKESN